MSTHSPSLFDAPGTEVVLGENGDGKKWIKGISFVKLSGNPDALYNTTATSDCQTLSGQILCDK